MATTATDSTLEVTRWEQRYFAEYMRTNQFSEYMGASAFAIVHINESLSDRKGDNVVIPLVANLSGAGVTGDNTLEGNEEALDDYGHTINADFIRHAVELSKQDQARSAINQLQAAEEQLKVWMMDKTRNDIIAALGSIDGVAYGTATAAQRDAWTDNNQDRVKFGTKALATDAPAGGATYDHSATLTDMTEAADSITASLLSSAKRKAKLASPSIRPFRVSDNLREEWFVVFMPSYAFRDAKEDTTILAANRDAWARGRDNPIFRDGDLIYDGMILREVPEIDILADVGSSGTDDVAPNYLCGAQAVGIGYKQRTRAIFNVRDYGMKKGTGVEENRGVEKLQSNFGTLKDHGVLTLFSVANPD